MPTRTDDTRIVVIGGGPAGAVTARALAMLDHEVVLLHEERRARTPEVESLPPSAAPVVAQLGLSDVIEAASVARMPGNIVLWAGAPAVETTLPEPGHQLARAVLDPQLRFAARTAGVDVREDVRGIEILEDETGADVRVRGPRGETTLRAGVVVVAVGRGTLRGAPRRTVPRGWRTLALSGGWTDIPALPAPRDASTWIESGEGGWVWMVPLGAGLRQVTLMIDPPPGAAAGPARLQGLYRRLLGGFPGTARVTEGGRLAWVRATDASASIVAPVATPRTVRVGDACATVDPIASFGIKKALSSARLAAAVVGTILRRPPAVARAALAQYEEAESREFAGSMAGAAVEAGRAAAFHGGSFWAARTFRSARSRAPLAPRVASPAMPLDGRPLALAGDARIEQCVLLEGWLFEERLALVSSHWPAGLRYLGGVDVPAAVEAARAGGTAAAIAERHRAVSGRDASPQAIESALGTLVAVGALAPR